MDSNNKYGNKQNLMRFAQESAGNSMQTTDAARYAEKAKRMTAEVYGNQNEYMQLLGAHALLAANATPKPGSVDAAVENLRNPQNSESYIALEGDVTEQTDSFQEASAYLNGNGVASNSDGTYTLKFDGQHSVTDKNGSLVQPGKQ